MSLPSLNATQQSLVNQVLEAYNAPYTSTSVDEFQAIYTTNLEENEDDFTFDEFEAICMYYGWA